MSSLSLQICHKPHVISVTVMALVLWDKTQQEGAILFQVGIQEALHQLLVHLLLDKILLLQMIRHKLESVASEDEAKIEHT